MGVAQNLEVDHQTAIVTVDIKSLFTKEDPVTFQIFLVY